MIDEVCLASDALTDLFLNTELIENPCELRPILVRINVYQSLRIAYIYEKWIEIDIFSQKVPNTYKII